MRRAWIVPACFYAIGAAAALVLVALIALGFPTLGLHCGLAIVCIPLVAFISAAVAYVRAPSRPPRITAITTRQEERTLVASMPYPGMSPRKEKTMARSTLVSPSEADKQ